MEDSKIISTIKKVLPAVVSITVSKNMPVFETPFEGAPLGGVGEFFAIPRGEKKVKVGGGSGFIIQTHGIILTNRHVVADPAAEYLVLLNDSRKFKAEVLARDPINDVAVLKINAQKLTTIKMGDSSKIQLGQTAIAIGNTLGIFPNTVSVGVVSGLSREIKAASDTPEEIIKLRGLIQTDAAINPGNSGGPLIDLNGNVIGINAAMVFLAENVGFALPINNAKKDLEDLKKFGRIRLPFLGIRYLLLDKVLQEKYDLPTAVGALVIAEPTAGGTLVAVAPDSPAHKAGIQEGDIILEMQSEKITAKNPLNEILQKFKVGDEITLKILKEEGEKILKVVLTEKF